MTREVMPERTGWRDEWISAWHRKIDPDCLMVDIDFLAVEYQNDYPVALVEYKEQHASEITPKPRGMRALGYLANGTRMDIPAFVVRYSKNSSVWSITPLNNCARKLFPEKQSITVVEYATMLSRLQGRKIPPEVLEELSK